MAKGLAGKRKVDELFRRHRPKQWIGVVSHHHRPALFEAMVQHFKSLGVNQSALLIAVDEVIKLSDNLQTTDDTWQTCYPKQLVWTDVPF